MVQLKISGRDEKKTASHARTVADVLNRLIPQCCGEDVQILGPIEAAIQKISGRFRWQILMKSKSAGCLKRMVTAMTATPEISRVKAVTIAVDVDPYFLM
tara:strand:- start:2131 stop:2430 length:300 start_codon:yes stop_codon:yes gene_type:complete